MVSGINALDALVRYVGKFASWLIIPLILVTVFDVVTRKFVVLQQLILESPLHNLLSPTKLQELEWHLHAAIFLLAFGFTYLSNAHVRVDLVRETLTPRKQMLVELLGLGLLALPYVSLLIFYAWDFVQTSFRQNEMSSAMTGLPHRWIIKSVFLAGIVLLCISMVSTVIRLLIILLAPTRDFQQALALGGSSQEKLHVLAHKAETSIDAELALNPQIAVMRDVNNTSGRES